MTLLEHFKDPNFWQILFQDLAIALLIIFIFVSLAWIVGSIAEIIAKRLNKKSLTVRLAEQEQRRFKK